MDDLLKHCYCQTQLLATTIGKISCEFCITSLALDTLETHKKAFLHPQELDHFATLTFPRRQQSYLLGHYLAKVALKKSLINIELPDILIRSGIFHQPVVDYPIHAGIPPHDKIHVSYSHSDTFGAAVAFPESFPLGIDIERVAADKNAVIESQLTTEEKVLIHTLSSVMPEKLYTVFWTLKEALSKVLRTGILSPFEIFAVKQITWDENCWRSEFTNFAQYQALSFPIRDAICSIVYPLNTHFTLDIASIQGFFQHQKDD